MDFMGRKIIYTDVPQITKENVIEVLQDAFKVHKKNASAFKFLLDYEQGQQPLQRKKLYRPEINVETNCGLANQITEFKTAFHYGSPITLIQAREKNNEAVIAELNDLFDIDNSFDKMQEIGRYCEIGGYGISYYEMNKEYEEGDCYFKKIPLNPQFAFIVYSGYYADHRKMMGVSYRVDDKTGDIYFTCITKKSIFIIKYLQSIENGNPTKNEWVHGNRSGELNILNKIPFVEWLRSYDRMGCFERLIPQIDALNIMESDFINDVDQNTQAVMFGVDIDFPKDENGEVVKPKSRDWLLAYSTENGKPSLSPIAVPYDYPGILSNISTTKANILEAAYVPCRNDNSGGSTGVAMSDATGWSGAEMIASKQQALIEKAVMEEVDIVLAIIKHSPDVAVDSNLRKLTKADVKPNIKRSKNYELTIKTNALAVMINNGVYGEDAFKTIGLFDDAQEVWLHSKPVVEAIQKKLAQDTTKAEKVELSDRIVDQVANSPNIDGMSKDGAEIE